MKMINPTPQSMSEEPAGSMILLFSMEGMGKTCSSLESAPGNLQAILSEKRDIKKNIIASGRDIKTLKYGYYEDYRGTVDYLADHNNFKDCDSILYDSISDSLELICKEAVTDEFQSKHKKAIEGRQDIDRRMFLENDVTWDSYDTMAEAQMNIIRLLGDHAKAGRTVICTARLGQPNKSQRAAGIEIVPLFKGIKFSDEAVGKFDLVGYVDTGYTYEKSEAKLPLTTFKSEATGKEYYVAKRPWVSFDKRPKMLTKFSGVAPDVEKGWNDMELNISEIVGYNKPKIKEK
jgi:YHS domain-containing protein